MSVAVQGACITLFALSVGCFIWRATAGGSHPDVDNGVVVAALLMFIMAFACAVTDANMAKFPKSAPRGNSTAIKHFLNLAEKVWTWIVGALLVVLIILFAIWTLGVGFLPGPIRRVIWFIL